MNGKNTTIEVNELNKHIKKYLTEGHKQKILPKEKIKYCNILKYLNHFLEIKNIQTTLDDNLKEEIELEINVEKAKEKDKQIAEESIKDDNKIKSFIDSFKNSNKAYVQQNLENLIKSLQKKK